MISCRLRILNPGRGQAGIPAAVFGPKLVAQGGGLFPVKDVKRVNPAILGDDAEFGFGKAFGIELDPQDILHPSKFVGDDRYR